MGTYINHTAEGVPLPARGKANSLIQDGAKEISDDEASQYQPCLVCVMENDLFDAAGFMYSANEHRQFYLDLSGRKRRWVIYPKVIDHPDILFVNGVLREHMEDFPVEYNDLTEAYWRANR